MIRLDRTAAPAVLVANAPTWTAEYLAKRAAGQRQRPDTRRYAHRDVRASLRAISHAKCFYCETKLAEAEETVDHFVEVADDPGLAYAWTNLYLSCAGCQRKIVSEPRSDGLDPCGDVDPVLHLTFDDEVIRPLDGSARGRSTIRRYQLDRQDLAYRRMKQLKVIHQLVIALQLREAGRLDDTAQESLRAFAEPEHAYSLMFRVVLRDLLSALGADSRPHGG